jgi:hypothetical protein
MRNIMDAVSKHRNIPRENQPAEDNSAHTSSPDHSVEEKTVVDINGQDLLQNNISRTESEPSVGGLDRSSVISETNGSTAGLNDDLNEFWIPSPSESPGWESGADESDLGFSGLHTPTEGSNCWDH